MHALVFLTLIAVPTAACWVLARAGPPRRRSLSALCVLAGWVLLVPFTIPVHLCHAGTPFSQWLFPGVVAAGATLVLPSRVARIGFCAGLYPLSIFLSMQYVAIVHNHGYTGDASAPRRAATRREYALSSAADDLRELGMDDDAPRPAGWLSETGLRLSLMTDGEGSRVTLRPAWHSWLTGIWLRESTRQRLWYPGGPPTRAADGLEWRDG